MDLWDAPVRDVRPALRDERRSLLADLRTLTAAEWDTPTAAEGWSVKDIALHVLDDDLGWLSRARDGDRSGLLAGFADHRSFVQALNAKNQRWVDAGRGLSPRVITDLLDWSGAEVGAWHDSVDLRGQGWVRWASDGPVPLWFDIAQDLTEVWVHGEQIRGALGAAGDGDRRGEVLRTFVWALPHQFHAAAQRGTLIAIRVDEDLAWSLISMGDGAWALEDGAAADPDAAIAATPDAAWRWLTGTAYEPGELRLSGPPALTSGLLEVRAIIV